MAWSLIRRSDSLRKQGGFMKSWELYWFWKTGLISANFFFFTPEGEHVPCDLQNNTSRCEAYLEANGAIVIRRQK
jgi:hypothetical protein